MRLTRRDFLATAAAAALANPALAGVQRTGGPAFGSTWRVVAAADPAIVRAAVERVVADTDAAMSPYRPDSELTRFNRSGDGGWHAATGALREVAAEALHVADATGGAFDPTVGPLVRRYGFGPISGESGAYQSVTAGTAGLRKADPGLTLDLCGIAKGDALDRIVVALARHGISDALVELGGETRALGRHPEGRPWAVAVETPDADTLAVQRIVAAGPLALATSGRSANGFGANGRSTAHIIDPRSARPVSGGVASVTVAANTARRADAWATALIVLGPELGPEVAERQGLATLFLLPDGDGLREVMTGGFATLVLE